MGNATSWPSSVLIFLVFWPLLTLVRSCPTECTCTNTTQTSGLAVYCFQKNLISVPVHIPLSASTLDLHDNGIQSLNECLSNLTELKLLNLSFNHLASLNASVFDNLHNLKTLDISYNVISTIQPKAFSDLISVDEVNLSANGIKCIESDILLGLQSARLLNFSRNWISNVSNKAFQFMDNLQILDLSYNDITVISVNMFKGLYSLKYLHLENNKIHTIDSGSFMDLNNLMELDLSGNYLTSLDKDVLSGLPNLTSLSMDNNHISLMDPQFMANSENLRILNLSGNSFQTVSIPLFTEFGNLQELYFSHMPSLITIAFCAFQGLSNLLIFDLSHNANLSFIHPDLFKDLTQLTTLDLSHNNISMLSELTFLHNHHLQQVSLEANVFQCSCGNAWLAGSNLVNISVFGSKVLECVASESVTIPISSVSGSELCPQLVQNNVSELEVILKIGSPGRLVCEFVSEPTTMVVWKTPRNKIFSYHPFHPLAASHLLSTKITNLQNSFHKHHEWHNNSGYYPDVQQMPDHIVLLSDGSLYIDYVLRTDTGPYKCLVQNSHYNTSVTITVKLVSYIFQIKIMSLIVGFSAATAFFLLTMLYLTIMAGAQRLINKRRRDAIRKLLENLDAYKNTQFSRLRDSYSNQLGRIRDQYHLQFGRIRENYSLQMKRVRKGCSDKVDRIKDNYATQVGRLRQYSAHQIEQIRELYSNQLLRIRDYSSVQLGRMHEKYKLQQQHVLKLLEAMNLDNCKNVIDTECMKAESKIFELIITDDDDQPLSTLGSDSEYLTATSSENSSHENLCIMVPAQDDSSGNECEIISETVQIDREESAQEKNPDLVITTNGIKYSDNHITETNV